MMGVYKITNKTTGRFYIGSSTNITARWRVHIEQLNAVKHHSYKLQSDWNQYGYTDFIF